jgi:hypothetical protein
MSKAHPGFKAVQSKIAAKNGVSKERAGAILGAATRGASAAAKRANPRLNRVKGKMHEGGTVPESGTYEMKKGEMVIPAPEKGMQHAAAERPSRPVPSNRERVGHLDVEAFCNDIESTGPGYYEINGTDKKFVRE